MDNKSKWGFLRETTEDAIKAGIDADTGMHRTGLNEYLAVIFPEVTDWVHDKTVDTLPKELKCRKRPDYRSESLKLIIEFDGTPHYDSPMQILSDYKSKALYEQYGYKVVRIPFFIQLTNAAIYELFERVVAEPMFDPNIPSMGPLGASPASISVAGLYRMAYEFHRFPQQYTVNLNFLKRIDNDFLTGAAMLEEVYNKISAMSVIEDRIIYT